MQIDVPIARGDRALLTMKEIMTDCVNVLELDVRCEWSVSIATFVGTGTCHSLSKVRCLCQPVSGVMCGLCLGYGLPADTRLNTNCGQMSADL